MLLIHQSQNQLKNLDMALKLHTYIAAVCDHILDVILKAIFSHQICHLILVNPPNAEATFVQSTGMQRFFENHLNPVMLVFIGELSPSTLSHFSGFLHHFVLATLANSSMRVDSRM